MYQSIELGNDAFAVVSDALNIHRDRCSDVIVDDRDTVIEASHGALVLVDKNRDIPYELTPHSQTQLLDSLEIRQTTAKNMLEHNQHKALVGWANERLQQSRNRHLLRGYQQQMRAWVTPGYPRIDLVVAWAVIVDIIKTHSFEITAANIDADGFRIVATGSPTDVRAVGSPVSFGVSFSASEIGQGSFMSALQALILKCLNGMTMTQNLFSWKRAHRGKVDYRLGELPAPEPWEFQDVWNDLESQTRLLTSQDNQTKVIDSLGTAAGDTIQGSLPGAILAYGKKFQLSTPEQLGIHSRLTAKGFDSGEYPRTRLGLFSAVTNVANKASSPARAAYLEGVGGNTLALSPSQWKVISNQKDPADKDNIFLN